ncbi:MAG TPA: ABC transporter permease [Acidimicrobiales bacterium]|nr:ABC transporter permease [Acidimicrobiales bacterium]
MTADVLDARGGFTRARALVDDLWGHPRYGWVVKAAVLYVLLVEVAVQLVFGRIDLPLVDWSLLEVGRYAKPLPREVLLDGGVVGALYALVGMGLILVYRANRIINFAQAQLGAVPAVVALLLIAKRGWPYLAVIPIVIIGGALLGGLTEVTLVRRFSNAPRLILTVVTIGVSLVLLILEFYAKQWVGGELIDTLAREYNSPLSGFEWRVGVATLTGDHLMTMLVVGVIVVALGAFFRFTDIGIAVRASAENAERASLLGIPTKRVSTIVWMLAAVLSAVGVFLRGPLIGIPLTGFVGLTTLLFGLAVAVMARMESLPMAFGAGLFIGVVDRAAIFATNRSSLATAAMFAVITGALLVQRSKLSRAMELGASSWQAVKELRPIPAELRDVPEVRRGRYAVFAVVGLLALAAPFVFGDVRTPQATIMVLYAIIGVSLVILTGWTGQISLGQYAIAGVGSAVAGGLAANHQWDFFGAVFTGAMVGALVAVLVGLPALRIQGLFLAVTTLAFAFAVEGFVLKREFFGWLLPEDGAFVSRPNLWGRIDLESSSELGPLTILPDAKFYYVCLAFLLLAVAMARSLRKNRTGRILIGARDNGRLVQAFGVNLAATRMAAFAVSGFIAGMAGSLLAYQNTVFSPGGFTADKSVELFVMSVIGGVGSIAGAVLGAIYVVGLPLLPGLRDIEFVQFLTTGLGLLVLLMVLPGGLAEGVYRVRDTLLRRVADKHGIHVPSLVADSLQVNEEVAVPDASVLPSDDAPPPAEIDVVEPAVARANGHRRAEVGGVR